VPAYFAEQPVLTDQAGHFLIKNLQPGREYALVAEGERGGAKARAEGVEVGANVTLELQAMGSVDAHIKGERKLASYTVTLEGPSARTKRIREPGDGFVFERLEAGDYILRVDADEGAAREELSVEAGGVTKLEIELEGYATIRGKLVDALDGEEIVGALVMNVPSNGDFDPSQVMAMMMGGGTKTNRHGDFELSKVRPGDGMLVFMDGAASFAQAGGGSMASVDYEVEGGDELDLGEITGMQTPKEEGGDAAKGVLGFASRVASYQQRPRPMGSELEDEEESEGDGDESERLWVSWVEIDGPADEAGLLPGDEITSVNGRAVGEIGAPAARGLFSPARVKVGDEVKLQLDRQGGSESVTIEAVAAEEEVD
jgi:hypothetical protein